MKTLDNLFSESENLAYYEPSGTYEYYDSESDIYYNKFGQELRSETEYDVTEGYTPFGDE